MKQRRKTTTMRRPAVSTETNEDNGSSSKDPLEGIQFTVKSDDVTAALLSGLQAHPLFEQLSKELLQSACCAHVEARQLSPPARVACIHVHVLHAPHTCAVALIARHHPARPRRLARATILPPTRTVGARAHVLDAVRLVLRACACVWAAQSASRRWSSTRTTTRWT